MQPIKWKIVEWVRRYYLPTDEEYEQVEYIPSEWCRLFDNELQARQAGFLAVWEEIPVQETPIEEAPEEEIETEEEND